MQGLHGGASCCQHTGYPQHVEESVKKADTIIFGWEEAKNGHVRVGAPGKVTQPCQMCDKWKEYKGVVPHFRRDGTVYFKDQRKKRDPDETIPRQLSGPRCPHPRPMQHRSQPRSGMPTNSTRCDLENLEDEDRYMKGKAGTQLPQESVEAASQRPEEEPIVWESARTRACRGTDRSAEYEVAGMQKGRA